MKIKGAIFLSHRINNRTPVYRGDSPVVLKNAKSIKKGDSCNTMSWSFSNHIGTHIDAPLHFVKNGRSVSDLHPRDLIFLKVKLVTLKSIKPGYMVTYYDLKGIRDCDLLLIKTGFESYRGKDAYWKNSVSLSPELAVPLKKRCPSLKAVGIDSISISNSNAKESGREAHRAFLSRGIILIEDMKLRDLKKEPGVVIAMPILVEGADASPCTVLTMNIK